jgi:Cu-Zn family superoxide dismutase
VRLRFPASGRRRRFAALAAAGVATTAGALVALPGASSANTVLAEAPITAADGTRLGSVGFTITPQGTWVRAHLQLPAGSTANSFHGFHLHANNDPANGQGCVADPAAAPSTWFTSADGHWSEVGQVHSAHTGDLPSLLFGADGTASLMFETQRFSPEALQGKVVIVHAGPDNFGNVPTGTAPDAYTANSPAAVEKTGKTGNAGDRLGCGVVEVGKTQAG